MPTTKRRASPLPMLLVLAVLLFAAGMAAGWTGAQAAAQENPSAPDSAPVPSEAYPSPTPIPGLDKPDGDGGTEERPLPTPVFEADKPSSALSAEGWALTLVNWEHPLPEDFTVPALVELRNGHAIDSRAYPALQAMMDDARAAGLQPVICSSFRTWEDQSRLFAQETQNWLDRGCTQAEAEAQAAAWVARPGASEHQTGLAVDIVDLSYQTLDQGQENTPVQKWLMAHCAEYGFVLRYPTGKSSLTGVSYEPWHYRYVGGQAARAIMENGLCLEEYLLA